MKTLVCLVLVCFLSGMAYASRENEKKSPTVYNTSIKKSEREMNAQVKNFQSHRLYSSYINSHRSKALKKQQAKNTGGL